MYIFRPLGFCPCAGGAPGGPAPRPGCAQPFGCTAPPRNNRNKTPSMGCSILTFGSLRSVPPARVESPGSVPVLVNLRLLVTSHRLVFILMVYWVWLLCSGWDRVFGSGPAPQHDRHHALTSRRPGGCSAWNARRVMPQSCTSPHVARAPELRPRAWKLFFERYGKV
jgi:hypothetical protein